MNKLQDSLLDKISDRNNGYRDELAVFKKSLEQLSTKLAGDTVTFSNYSLDFSSVMDIIKEKLIDEIYQVVESYAIKDLRNVESVNAQFIDKINDRIENSEINNEDDKNSFISSLNNLLSEKYLEIVRIKRTEFFDYEDGNLSVEERVNDFISYLNSKFNFDQKKMEDLIETYKKDLYNNIKNMFNKINNLYLSVFTEEVISSLTVDEIAEDNSKKEVLNVFENVPEVPDMSSITNDIDIPEVPDVSSITNDINVPEVPDISSMFAAPTLEVNNNLNIDEPKAESVPAMEVPEVNPIEVNQKNANKKTYDVDEILKIAKSPVVTLPEKEDAPKKNDYISVTPIKRVEETESVEVEFDEREIVEEMIKRLNRRLEDIKIRQDKYSSDEKKVIDDEKFVNELIENSNNKKLELDKLEKELDEKEREINDKKVSLDKKIKDIMPFANAVLKSE